MNNARNMEHGTREAGTGSMLRLVLATFLLFGANNATTAAMPAFVMHIGGGAFIAGLQNSLFVLSAILLRLAFGPLADRIGSKPLLLAGAAGFFAPFALLPLCDNLFAVVALRIAQAVGLAAFHPNVAHYLAANSSPESTPRRVSLSRFASTASLMAIPALLGPIAGAMQYGLFFAALAALSAIGFFLVLGLNDRGASRPPKPTAKQEPQTSKQSLPRKEMLEFAPIVCMPFILALGYSVLLVFGSMLVEEHSLSSNGGLLFTLVGFGGLVGTLAVPWLMRRFDSAVATSVLTAIFSFGMACLACAPLGWIPVGAGALAAGFGYFGCSCAMIISLSARAPKKASGSMLAAQQSFLDLGMVVGSLVVGAILQAGCSLTAAFLFAGALLAICAAAWGVQARRAKRIQL